MSQHVSRISNRLFEYSTWRWIRHKRPSLTKAAIVNLLGRENAYSSYLEIASYTTGLKYAEVDEGRFQTKQRLLYNIPPGYDDGHPVDYASGDETGAGPLQSILDSEQRFDVVFVDPYHSYEASLLNIEQGFRMLETGGVMVVHDCNPPHRRIASATRRQGAWCGETYRAFLDFVGRHPELEYCVVDTDWGVGLVYRAGHETPAVHGPLPSRTRLAEFNPVDWHIFDANRQALLRLISVEDFYRIYIKNNGQGR